MFIKSNHFAIHFLVILSPHMRVNTLNGYAELGMFIIWYSMFIVAQCSHHVLGHSINNE